MAVNLSAPIAAELKPVKGVRLATTSAGIKKPGRQDVVLIELASGSHTAAVYTRNAFCAAPVLLAREHQQQSSTRYLLINSGNANAGTGDAGMAAAKACCQAVAQLAECDTRAVLPFSTGVIGQPLPVDKITNALPEAFTKLAADNWFAAAHAIMTTDTIAKARSVELSLNGQPITLTGIAKGSGMIRPDMATLLSYIATDAAISASTLQKMLDVSMEQSFNSITVDGDTSTNDACVLIATGLAGNSIIDDIDSSDAQQFIEALNSLSRFLAQAIVRDGEGATKFISIDVQQGADADECRQVAYTIAHSPLVKTALFASDPNWGRILAAVGRSGLPSLDLSKIAIYLDNVCIVDGGQPAADYTEEKGQQVMSQSEITIRVKLGRGNVAKTVWTCDFSYDYVKINAEYRT
ncbi:MULTISPECIES: bifunctional glutamate N-acetyltransferase/amino-acid acetyltransferase ArgJ [unclassified Methylophaga]|jgi:glutamate N-acetyltransferase / amino-acid N-acetyltransferase|uniref:Arginine biosynthesis bifunctional protein ArgJ n=1 Tax=Pseudidiomarina aestuarii TaxID=624146 RepID=A0A2T4CYK5_9GAMM|nr:MULTISPECIES: bifunctional glutamate N-acetyltransferase/amino-acid acetyltransferase ArgJ [unclassified Methylophaga]PTB86635.1 bifunctional ornithine acetyltransferase/N-acetylglutamate synthase [Pseudidiomarina aestuarii]MAL50328.1 bifunctional ornithine acetyltransferase/N-acetylglutamate synthase [Methylophaga sp.]MAP28239.1 bifunctional ornithine acetyltransferase/N-acetylglutamate synthase [Methylophaga sp.]MBP26472.1 bifunctional ornithine acetyltransferase/N-acetylglutamate synthase|tara:strand:+ start:2782 stop:4008 length:1227 start_codon:yes stop_codon:yes gene_type:complete